MHNPHLTKCNACGSLTSRVYARKHKGQCKHCAEGTKRPENTRNARIIDSGWEAYAREEGHYDLPDNY